MGLLWSSNQEPLITTLPSSPSVTEDHRWLEYLLRWVRLDSRHDGSITEYQDRLFEDLANHKIHLTRQQFMDRYKGIKPHLFPLGQTAYEITLTNYALRELH